MQRMKEDEMGDNLTSLATSGAKQDANKRAAGYGHTANWLSHT